MRSDGLLPIQAIRAEASWEKSIRKGHIENAAKAIVLKDAKAFERPLDDTVEAILVNDESKRKFRQLADNVARIFRAVKPDPLANEFLPVCALTAVIAEKIRSLTQQADISTVMTDVETLLDDSIAAEGYLISGQKSIDLSKIDFEKLKAQFERGRKRIEAERLRGAVNSKLQKMVRLNGSRLDYSETFQQLIDEYNAGSVNIEEFFDRLVNFARGLNQEEQRGIAEGLSEEELAVFDLLTRPEMKLTKKEEQQVKKVARKLLGTLKSEKLVLDWRKKQQTRAAVRLTIEQVFELLPPVFAPSIYQQKCQSVYEHIYDSYYGQGMSIYRSVA